SLRMSPLTPSLSPEGIGEQDSDMKRFLLYLVLPLLLLLWARSALYSVDVGEFAYVTLFGGHIAVFDGGTDAGLHAKLPWPIDSVLRVDRRLQAFELPSVEALTRDPADR